MNTLIEQGIVREIESGNNFEYIVNASASFIDTDYKVLQSQSNDVFVKCMKITRNGLVDLCYLGNDYRTVESLMAGLTADTAIAIVAGILSCITKVKANGFLSCQSIVLDKNRIFVDANTKQVRLVYVPITEKLFATPVDFEEEVRNIICEILNGVSRGLTEQLQNLVGDVEDRNIPLDLIYQKSRAIVPEVASTRTASAPVHQAHATTTTSAGPGSIRLVACDAPYPFEISISENDVLIGKKADLVDKAIEYNGAISRRHCRIVKQDGSFFIMDEGSANGTFVNGVRLEQGRRQIIKQGDIVRLANSDFRVD